MPRLSWALLMAVVVVAQTATAATPGCTGDCNGSGAVTVNEVITIANVMLGTASVSACLPGDADSNGRITIDEVQAAVNNALAGCPVAPTPTPVPEESCPDRNPLRNVYFGDLHVHTTYSFDAYLWDVRTTPGDAYRFARGEPLLLPPLDAQGNGTRMAQLERPLDFTAVTDHAEFLGEVETCIVPGSGGYDSPTCQQFRAGGATIYANIGARLIGSNPTRLADVCGADGKICRDAAGEVWSRIQDAAATAYDHCHFTSFVAYEYSRAFSGSTMHRNVIFRNAQVPFPVSTFEEPTPQGLWRELQASCLDAGTGCDVLAIPHNTNESNGRTFFVEYPGAQGIGDQRVQAQFRGAIEPLVEVYQHKASSECFNGLSGILGAPDEQCDFEKRRQGPVIDCGDRVGSLGAVTMGCVSRLDYARGALLAGLREEDRLGVNPYRLGFIASTDTHNGTPGHTEEWNFMGNQGANDASPAVLLGPRTFVSEGIVFSPGGLAAVWAEENSRSSIFDALRRKETFGTSGTRLSVRVFGGWNLPANLCTDPNLVQSGYAQGVPMGGVLGPRPAGAGAPMFVIDAFRDPGTAAHPGAQLQRLQVIKGWIADGQATQHVYDVAGEPGNGATVDLTTCMPQGSGHDSLCTVWTDPDFDPAQHAFYYVRVLENPTCRWNTWLCNALPPDQQQPSCTDPTVPKTVQERAWTSPIWYTP